MSLKSKPLDLKILTHKLTNLVTVIEGNALLFQLQNPQCEEAGEILEACRQMMEELRQFR